MNKRKYINSMGINKISEFDLRTIKRFKENNLLTRGLSDREILILFENSTSFAFTRLSVAASGMGYVIKEVIKDSKKENSFLRKIYNRLKFKKKSLLDY